MRSKYSKISLRKILPKFFNHTQNEEFFSCDLMEGLAMGLREGQQSNEFRLCVYTTDVPALVRFFKAAFNAVETYRAGSGIYAAGVRVPGCHITVIRTSMPAKPVMPIIYVPHVEWAVEHARALGGRLVSSLSITEVAPVVGTLMGDHACRLIDPAGHLYEVRSWRETVSLELATMRKRLVDQRQAG